MNMASTSTHYGEGIQPTCTCTYVNVIPTVQRLHAIQSDAGAHRAAWGTHSNGFIFVDEHASVFTVKLTVKKHR
jgi:hypothetical protein